MLVIFDWDGTLIDSSAKIVECMQRAASDLGFPALPAEVVRRIIGLGLPEAISSLYPDSGADDRERFRELYSQHFVEADRQPCEFFPGTMQILSGLRDDGHYLAVATGKSRRGLNRVLGNLQLEDFFHGSRCADETRSKPHPLMLQELLDEFSFNNSEAVMVGDTTYDMEMAQRASVARVAVSYGAHSVEEMNAFSPMGVIDQMDELISIVEHLKQ